MDLERRPWSPKSTPAKGPKRLCKFCILAVILPIICLCVPLYMRFQALKPQVFTLSPSDMKLLNQVGIWIRILAVICPIFIKLLPFYIVYLLSLSFLSLQDSRISTVWCQGQELRMNGSFNAYLLPSKPRLRRFRQHVTMTRKMILEDDIKEYWGFYLLRGSQVRLSTCARYVGSSFIIVKGMF